jgi:uncharacterized OB-fold protein
VSSKTVNADLLSVDDAGSITLLGTRCDECFETFFGRRQFCEYCSSDRMSDVELSLEGTVHTATVVRYPPPGDYRDASRQAPFNVGLIAMPEGLLILGQIDDIEVGAPTRGLAVRAIARAAYVDDDGDPVYGYTFTPANGAAL